LDGSRAKEMGSSPDAITENQSVFVDVEDSTVLSEVDKVRVRGEGGVYGEDDVTFWMQDDSKFPPKHRRTYDAAWPRP
jgi:hypothetical protein